MAAALVAALICAPLAPAVAANQQTGLQIRRTTESVTILGQQVVFSNPSGYCTPGKTAREVELVEFARRAMGPGTRLVHSAVRCSELEDYRSGRRGNLDHWLQIQLIGPQGNFRRVEMQREAFLAGIAKSVPRLDLQDIQRKIETTLDQVEVGMSDVKIEPIGRDGNAVYFSVRMNVVASGSSRLVTGITGITLLNSLPLSVNVYEGTGSPKSRAQLQTVHQELMASLLTEN